MIEIRPIVQATGPDNPARQISVTNWNIGHALTASPNVLIGTDGTGNEAEYPIGGPGGFPTWDDFVTALDGKVSVTGDTMTGQLTVEDAIYADDLVAVGPNPSTGGSINSFTSDYAAGMQFFSSLTWGAWFTSTHPYTFSINDNPVVEIALGAVEVTGTLAVDDQAHGPVWDGNFTVPTKNAVYDALATKANASDLGAYIPLTQKGAPGGVVPLNGSTLIDAIYLPSYVDDVVEYANLASFPATGETGKIYVAIDTGKTYRWSGSGYVEISSGGGAGITDGDKGDVVVSGVGTVLTVESATPADGSFNVTGSITATTSIIANSLLAVSTTARNPGVYSYSNGGNDYGMELGFATTGTLDYVTRLFATNRDIVLCGISMGGTLQSNFSDYARFGAAGAAIGGNLAVTGTITSGGSSLATVSQLANYVAKAGDTMTGDLLVPDEVYGPAWDGSPEVPTKNAVYDKVQSLITGGISVTDGDKGDVLVSIAGTHWVVQSAEGDFTATGIVTSTGGPGTGSSNIRPGDSINSGYANFFMPDTTRAGYVGLSSPTVMSMVAEGGRTMVVQAAAHGWRDASAVTLLTLNGTALTSIVPVIVPTEGYGPGWDSDYSVPTKHALYDKIEAIAGTGSIYVLRAGDTMTGSLTVGSNEIGLSGLSLGNASFPATIQFNHSTGLGSIVGPTDSYHAIKFNCDEHFFANAASSIEFARINASGVTVPDQAYGVAWDGNFTVPTKNAVYDKIQALTVGGGATLADGDYGDVLVSGTGAVMTVQSAAGAFTTGGNVTVNATGYSGTAGQNPKLLVYDGGSAAVQYGLGISTFQFDYMAPASASHAFYVGGVKVGAFSDTGLAVTGTITSGGSTLATVSQLANYLPLTGGTVSGQLNTQAGILTTGSATARFQNGGGSTPTGASGVGLEIYQASGRSWLSSYNYTASDYAPVSLRGSGFTYEATSGIHDFYVGGVNYASITSTGLAVTGKVSASNGVNANSTHLSSTTARNPGAYVHYNGSNHYGIELGHDSTYYATRLFTSLGQIVTIGSCNGGASQTDFADWAKFSATGLILTGNITATGTITSSGAPLATVSQLANYLPLTGGSLSGPITMPGHASTKTGINRIVLCESGGNTGYAIKMGYYNTGVWGASIDVVQGGTAGAQLDLNPTGGAVVTGSHLTVGGGLTTNAINATGNIVATGTVAAAILQCQGASAGLFIGTRDTGADWQLWNSAGVMGWHNGSQRMTLGPTGDLDVTGNINIAAGKQFTINGVPIGGGGGLTDGDKGDVLVGGSGTTMTVESSNATFNVGNGYLALRSGGPAGTQQGYLFASSGQIDYGAAAGHYFKNGDGTAGGNIYAATLTATGAITSGGSTLATVSQLANYLPLTGGTILGGLNIGTSTDQFRIFASGGGGMGYIQFGTVSSVGLSLTIGGFGGVTLPGLTLQAAIIDLGGIATANSTGFYVSAGKTLTAGGDVNISGNVTVAAGKTLSGSGGLAISGNASVSGAITATGTITTTAIDLNPTTPGTSGINGFANDVVVAANGWLSLKAQTVTVAVIKNTGIEVQAGMTILVPDDPYAAGWNGSTAVPTKNAIWDKIESMGAGGGLTDGDKGDVLVASSGASLTVESATPAGGSFNVTGDLIVAKATGDVNHNITVTGTSGNANLNFARTTTGVVGFLRLDSIDGIWLQNDVGSINLDGQTGVDLQFNGVTQLSVASTKIQTAVALEVPDVAYAAGWNGSLAVPTRNAVYDKIQTLAPLLATITAKTATYTLVQADAGGALTFSGTTLTCNLANLSAGTMVIVRNIHASSPVTIALNSCTLLKNGATASAAGTLAAGGVVTLMCWGSSVWTATGSGLT